MKVIDHIRQAKETLISFEILPPLKGKTINSIYDNNGSIQADSGRFELGHIPVPDRTGFSEKLITASVKNESDNSITFAYIIKLYNKREPRNFEDARGFVINDYQEYLENQWLVELRKKYPVTVNEAVFASLQK